MKCINTTLFFIVASVVIAISISSVVGIQSVSAKDASKLLVESATECENQGFVDKLRERADGLLFFADFDGSPEAKYSYGDGRVTNPTTKYSYAPGISGQGLLVSGDYDIAPEYLASGNIAEASGTIGFWFKSLERKTTQKTGQNRWLFSSNGSAWRFYLYLTGDTVRFDYFMSSDMPDLVADTWNYLTLRWSPDKISLLVNGEIVKQGPVLSNWKSLWDIGKTFTIGGYRGGSPVDGIFDDFTIWNRYLEDNEIKALYKMAGCNVSFAAKIPPGHKDESGIVLNTNDIVMNGSFEAGLNNQIMIEMPVPHSPAMPSFPVDGNHNGRAVIFQGDAYHGKQSLKLEIPPLSRNANRYIQPNRGTARIQTLAFKLGRETEYSISFRIKVLEGAGVTADLDLEAIRSLESQPAGYRKKVTIKAGDNKWKFVAVSGLPHDAYDDLFRLRIGIKNTGTGYASVLIDAIQVIPLSEISSVESINYKDIIAASLHTSKLANIFTRQEKAEFSISLSGQREALVKTGLVFDVYDLWGKNILSKTIDVSIDGADKTQFNVPVNTNHSGIFRATISYPDTGYVLDEATFSVLPDTSDIPELAAHVSHDDYVMAVAKRMGIRWNRVWDNSRATTWPMIQPESSAEYRWDYADSVIEKFTSNNFKLVGLLSWPRSKWARNWTDNKRPHWLHSRWNTKDENVVDYKLFYNDNFKNDWLDYVKNVVTRYRGVIQYWELLNEPYQDGPPSWVADIYKAAVPVIRKANPEAIIVGPSIHDNIKWNSELVSLDILNDIDVFSYHGYYMEADALGRMHAISENDNRQRLVFDTENSGISSGELFCVSCLGGAYTGHMTPEESAIRIAKSLIQSLHSGTDKFFYYWMVRYDPYEKVGSFIDFTGKLTPAAVSYVAVSSMLNGTSHVEGGCTESNDISCHVFRNDNTGKFVVALWAKNESFLSNSGLNVNDLPVAYDVVGGVVNLGDPSSPVYTAPGVPVFILSDSRHNLPFILNLFGLAQAVQ